ncbi:MAG: carbohydrate kinase, partial [Firmicutes bacterium]|nr:carbohydrate kinase [Bacillota bacterium]
GAALVVAAGVKGEDVLELSRRLVKPERVYTPNPDNKELYERNYRVFKRLYKSNAKNFRIINE